MIEPRSFGEWVRRERERRGVELRDVADRTKIGARHLRGLERGDISSWPGGLYRRAFVRSYAEAVGLDADLVVERFLVAFPDPEAAADPAAALDSGSPLRLHLAAPASPPWHAKVRIACFDVAFALAIGLIGLAAAGAVGFWCATAVAALVHHVRSVLDAGRTRPGRLVRESPPGVRAAAAGLLESLKQKVEAGASMIR